MYAIIETSGRQYKVEEGNTLYTEKQTTEPGKEIIFDKVLMLRTDDEVLTGKPYLDAVKVRATLMENIKDDKVLVVKFGSRKMYRRTKGHRQWLSALRIDKIERA